MPDTALPDTALPDTALPDTALPDTALPDTALPDTTVTLTGTGVPHPVPGRAGAGTLVRYGDLSLQFDAGRSTVMRMVEAGVAPFELTAIFLTDVHSDHVVDLPDLAMTRWVQQQLHFLPHLYAHVNGAGPHS